MSFSKNVEFRLLSNLLKVVAIDYMNTYRQKSLHPCPRLESSTSIKCTLEH